jgi:hypothetical protein
MKRKAARIDVSEICKVTVAGASAINLQADFKEKCVLSIKGKSVFF